jgi:hypothetical protein
LIDVAMLSFFVVARNAAQVVPIACVPWWRRPRLLLGSGVLHGVIAFQIGATEKLKQHIDGSAAAKALLERALRAGWLKPNELSFAPFGFVRWHLFPYYLKHEGRDSFDLGGFNGYIAQDSMDLRFDDISRNERKALVAGGIAPDPAHPYSGIFPWGWFGCKRVTLIHTDTGKFPEATIHWADYHFTPFPLNDAEWRDYLRALPGE